MKTCTLSEDALLKVLLHAAKHPTTAVNGVLLGTVSVAAVLGSHGSAKEPPQADVAAAPAAAATAAADAAPPAALCLPCSLVQRPLCLHAGERQRWRR